MSKTIPIGLATNFASGAPTPAHALRVTRRDGQVFGFTSASRSATISGVVYDAAQGLDASAIVTAAGLETDNLELTTLDDGSLFTHADVVGGVWQGAAFLIFRYSWADPAAGIEPVMAGTFGNVWLRQGAIVVELRGLQQYLQQPVGAITSKTCRANFGDYPRPNGNSRCGLSASAWTDSLVVAAVTDSRTFAAELAPVPGGDPSWASVAMLLRGDGSLADSSDAGRTVTAVGNARVDAGQSKWGGSSLFFDGSGDCMIAANTPAVSLTGDFTFRAWVYIAASTGSNQAIVTMGGANWELYYRPGSGGVLALYNGSNVIIGSTPMVIGQWHFVSWTRSAGVHRLALDGVSQGTYSSAATITPGSGMFLGSYNNTGTSEPLSGYLDDVQLTVGVARDYTEVPTGPFPNFGIVSPVTRPDDWYAEGVILWQTGANAGSYSKVRSYEAEVFQLVTDPPHPPQIGDEFSGVAGCRKRLDEDCAAKFSNARRFQAEPHRPSIDTLTSSPEPAA